MNNSVGMLGERLEDESDTDGGGIKWGSRQKGDVRWWLQRYDKEIVKEMPKYN